MECEVFLGSICILLEDLGFKRRFNHREDAPMSYYFMARLSMEKVFADINIDYTVEMFLDVDSLLADRWKLNPGGIYMVTDELNVNMHDPNSLPQVTSFVEETIACAK